MDAKSTVHVVNGDVFYSPNCARILTLPAAGEDHLYSFLADFYRTLTLSVILLLRLCALDF
jgi:hypothetical protein